MEFGAGTHGRVLVRMIVTKGCEVDYGHEKSITNVLFRFHDTCMHAMCLFSIIWRAAACTAPHPDLLVHASKQPQVIIRPDRLVYEKVLSTGTQILHRPRGHTLR